LIVVAGVILAFCAGAVNVIAKLQLGTVVSHVTGTVTEIGMRIEDVHEKTETVANVFEAVALLGAFILGALLCGVCVSKNEVHFGKSLYGVTLLGNSFFLFLALGIYSQWSKNDILNPGFLPAVLCAMACGLQNGMCTMHFGAVVRTTHVTGLCTDLGLTLGRMVAIIIKGARQGLNAIDRAEMEVDVQKAGVFMSILAGFFLWLHERRLLGRTTWLQRTCGAGVNHWGEWAVVHIFPRSSQEAV
jgi:uncharacterized membrane protein YoaK (UPF0700 family)